MWDNAKTVNWPVLRLSLLLFPFRALSRAFDVAASSRSAQEQTIVRPRNAPTRAQWKSGLTPVDICGGRTPCMTTTALERIERRNCGFSNSNSLWEGKWEADRPWDGLRFHSAQGNEGACEISDIFWLAVNKKIRGHVNDAKLQFLDFRLDGLRNKVWLMIGTSIDHRITRLLCKLLGAKTEPLRHPSDSSKLPGDFCVWEPFNFTFAYVFGGPINSYGGIWKSLSSFSFLRPHFISLAGIEWGLLHLPKHWTTTQFLTDLRNKIIRIRNTFSGALLVARNNYLTKSALRGPKKEAHKAMLRMFYEVSQENKTDSQCSFGTRIHLWDVASFMGSRAPNLNSKGWTDGLHWSHWVMYQYVNLCLHQLSDLAIYCAHAKDNASNIL